MSRRIEIELTSARQDGTWTWRAAGAREPKGVLDGALLPTGAKIGSVLKADAEVELDGMTILSVTTTKEKAEKSAGLEARPRSKILRIQVGTRVLSGGGETVPATTLAINASAFEPANGRWP